LQIIFYKNISGKNIKRNFFSQKHFFIFIKTFLENTNKKYLFQAI